MLNRVKDPGTGFPILPPGTQLPGGWQIKNLLGAGGFGSVYIANGPQGICALKEFRPHPQLSAEAMNERVDMEADVVRSFQNHPCLPNFIAQFDVGNDRFLAEQFIPGLPLNRLLRNGASAFSLGECLAWLCILTRTLDHLHRRLLLYQDLKPANILITPERFPVLVDFGAARHYAGVKANPRLLFGSLGYVAPEIMTDPASQRDYRSDVYSLGCLCYTLLTGRPLEREQILGKKGIMTPSKALLQFRPEASLLPPGWLHQIDEMLLLALQPDPADRLADLKWFFKRFQGLIIGAGDTEKVDGLIRVLHNQLAEQDRLIDAAAYQEAEGDPANIQYEPKILTFAPVDVSSELITQPVSIWSTTGKAIRASVTHAGIGIEPVENHLRAVEGRIRVRITPRKVAGVNNWTRCSLILRLHTNRQVRIPIHVFVVPSDSPYLKGAPLPDAPDEDGKDYQAENKLAPGVPYGPESGLLPDW